MNGPSSPKLSIETVTADTSATPAAARAVSITAESDFVCEACGSPLMDCGVIGVECPNRDCPDNVRLMRQVRGLFAKAPAR